MDTGQRMAGAYKVFLALHVGDKEIVVGENTESQGEKYMCGFCETNDLFALYSELAVSDDYLEIVGLYGSRIAEQAEKARAAAEAARAPQIDEAPITAEGCDPITYAENIEGKIVVIKPDVLRREYRFATHQIKLCEGGFGAHGNSRGNACYCVDLFSGQRSRFERYDILGTLDESRLPEWAKQGLDRIRTEAAKEKPPRSKEER
jgi:hypothetical protein